MSTVYLLLGLSILSSSLINLIFKSFSEKVDKMSAIVVNYFVCVIVAVAVNGRESVFFTDFWNKPWFIYAALLGFLFISIFYLIALTNQYSGVSVAAAASKLGVIVPVLAGVFLFHEEILWTTILAIIFSLVGVVLISRKGSGQLAGKWMGILLPMTVLLGSGIIDATLKFIQAQHLGDSPENHPTTIIFASAGIIGLLFLLVTRKNKSSLFQRRTLVNGIILGVPNYFSILLLLMVLNTGKLTSVVVYTLNNISIVAFSAIASILIFREKMSLGNIVGLILALISIYLISSYQ